MTNLEAREYLIQVDRRLLSLLLADQDADKDNSLKAARLYVKRAYDAVWEAGSPLPHSGRALADDAALYAGLRALGVKY